MPEVRAVTTVVTTHTVASEMPAMTSSRPTRVRGDRLTLATGVRSAQSAVGQKADDGYYRANQPRPEGQCRGPGEHDR